MRKTLLTFTLVSAGILLAMVSCDDNSHSLGSFGIDIATVNPEGEDAYSLLLDNGKRLWPAASAVPYNPTFNQRVFLNYTILSDAQSGYDHYVKVNDIWNILTKDVIELNAENADSIGNDPVKSNAVWVGGDYLNVSFMFNYGGVKPHAINLVKNSASAVSSDDPINLEFRHNAYQSDRTKLFEGFVCFDLKPLRSSTADSVLLSVKVKEWDKDVTYDVIYRYNEASVNTRTEIPIPVISSDEYY
ncbi:NigD-like N-terminal domain-containing protein [Dysgonomonadaceae bacterium zrk40]|nr:NigD-like N-terminal domain-containing protein [Dysgonomonadaceae bacterium zrk40]